MQSPSLTIFLTSSESALGEQYVKDTWFAIVDGQTGSIGSAADNIASTAEYKPDEWPDGVDAIVCGLDGSNRPGFVPVYDASGNEINVSSFTTAGASGGDYTLSHTPTGDVAFVFRYRVQRRFYDESKSLGDFDVEGLKVEDIQGTENQITVDSVNGQIIISLPSAILDKLVNGGNLHDHSDGDGAAIPDGGLATQYLKADGSRELAADWDIGDGRKILAGEMRARSGYGLTFTDDSGNYGISLADGGKVGINTSSPSATFDIGGLLYWIGTNYDSTVGIRADDAIITVQGGGYDEQQTAGIDLIGGHGNNYDDYSIRIKGERTAGAGSDGAKLYFIPLRRLPSGPPQEQTTALTITHDRNVIIGGTDAGTSATKNLIIAHGTAPTTVVSGAALWSEAGHLYACDSGTTTGTPLTPHVFDLFNPSEDEPYPWSFYAENAFLGTAINVDMAGAIRAIEDLSGKQFIYYGGIDQRDLVAEQKEQWKTDWINDNTNEIEIDLSDALEEVDVEVDTDEVDYEQTCYALNKNEIKEKKKKIYKKTIKKEWRVKPGVRFCTETGKCFEKIVPSEQEAESAAQEGFEADIPKWLADRLE